MGPGLATNGTVQDKRKTLIRRINTGSFRGSPSGLELPVASKNGSSRSKAMAAITASPFPRPVPSPSSAMAICSPNNRPARRERRGVMATLGADPRTVSTVRRSSNVIATVSLPALERLSRGVPAHVRWLEAITKLPLERLFRPASETSTRRSSGHHSIRAITPLDGITGATKRRRHIASYTLTPAHPSSAAQFRGSEYSCIYHI